MQFSWVPQLFVALLFLLSIQALGSPKACVVSLFQDKEINERFQNGANQLLTEMGYQPDRAPLYDFKKQEGDSVKAIRDCLQGDYEDVILIAHTMNFNGHRSIYYRVSYQTDPIPLDEDVFENLKIKKSLRQITLIVCSPEEVLDEYTNLKELIEKNHIRIRFQPEMVIDDIGYTTLGVRSEALVGAMIAESAQDANAWDIFCLLTSRIVLLYEYGSTSCLRNHYEVSLHAPASVGIKTSTKWAKIHVGGDLKVLDAEVGFLKGIDLSISQSPLKTAHESYGASVALFQYFNVKKVLP